MILAKNYIFLLLRLALKFIPHRIKKMIHLDLNFERILQKGFPPNSPFYFIQVGGLDGKSFDGLYDFVNKRRSKGIIIEPLPDYFLKLKENYAFNHEILLINKAVHPELDEVILYRTNPLIIEQLPDWAAGIASLDPEHYKKSGIDPKHIITEKVPAAPLMNLIKEFVQENKADLFQCDVEGFDLETVKMIDFSLLKPSLIKFEYVNLDKREINEAKSLLKKQGYFCFYQYPDIIAVQLRQLSL
jgi:FkbM family methyltransferase